jgi:hypothetical protein
VVSEAYSAQPPKPVVVTEPWYEFVEGNPTGRDIRFGAWTAILSGAAGHTYGGGHVWLADVPESPAEGGSWPLEKGFDRNTLNYEGAVSMSILSGFFRKLEWWKMAPHPELISEYPDKYCLASPGLEYIIYLRWGGTCKLNLLSSRKEDEFEYYWFNPATGKESGHSTVKGGAVRFFSSPGGYPGSVHFSDWVLYLHKK